MNIYDRVEALRRLMAERDLDAYIIPTSDPHQSENVPNYYKDREFITGFTGSAGTAIVTTKKAGLWTDGRYFLQAEEELKNGPFDLYRMGTKDPTMIDFLKAEVPEFGKIGFDGLCMAASQYKDLSRAMERRALVSDVDFVSEIWDNRPPLPTGKAFYFDEKYTGKSIKDKLEILRFMLRDRGVDYTFIGALEDICYLFNIRGRDVKDTMVVLSYALISQDRAILFIDQEKVTDSLHERLQEEGVELYAYDSVASVLEEIPAQKVVYLDPRKVNIRLYQSFRSYVKIRAGVNLTSMMKAIKNDVELENTRKAFIKDGAALVKFFNWVEMGAQTGVVNERSASHRLHEFRASQEDFLSDSFEAIVGYGPNAAIVHYNPMTSRRPAVIENKGLLLVDSGGHYLQGTTDITRTYAMGPVTEEEKHDYTLVLKAHIAGVTAQIPKGTKGAYIHDIVRQPLLQDHKDFNHGTGHGVGFVLAVHEGPMAFSSNDGGMELAPGMVISMEPGLYVTDKHGIRLESIILCVETGDENDFGHWLAFENLTWVPLDTRPVDVDLLTDKELAWLNDYNATCYEKLAPELEGDDLNYLKKLCQPLKRKAASRE